MADERLRDRVERHLRVLAEDIGARPPGSPANRRAVEHVRGVLVAAGLEVRESPFTTRWWEPGDGRLDGPTGATSVAPNPFSPPCDVEGAALRITSPRQLEAVEDASRRILVLAGELAREPVMPKTFPFFNPEEHRRLVAAVEAARPLAVVAVSDGWQPVFEDPDLTFPSTTVPPAVGDSLRTGVHLALRLGGAVHDGVGSTVAGRTAAPSPRVVLSAHVDSKVTTPGAFDNAGGVAVLLALVETGLDDLGAVEVVAFNGEDHFDACGEVAWLADTELGEVAADVNVDGVGLAGHGTSLAWLACTPALEARLERFVADRPGWVAADPWVESDHAIFAMRGIPALAVTSEDVHALLGSLAHGPADTVDVVDLDVLVDVAAGLRALLAPDGPIGLMGPSAAGDGR